MEFFFLKREATHGLYMELRKHSQMDNTAGMESK